MEERSRQELGVKQRCGNSSATERFEPQIRASTTTYLSRQSVTDREGAHRKVFQLQLQRKGFCGNLKNERTLKNGCSIFSVTAISEAALDFVCNRHVSSPNFTAPNQHCIQDSSLAETLLRSPVIPCFSADSGSQNDKKSLQLRIRG